MWHLTLLALCHNPKIRKMENYRFHLQKYRTGGKLQCPKCGQRSCFTPYVDDANEVQFPYYVGRCDHENSCKYHFTPAQFFEQNPQKFLEKSSFVPKISEQKLPSFIEKSIVKATQKCYTKNNLFVFMAEKFGIAQAESIFKEYRVGTARKWNCSTVFWQIDAQERVHAGKIMVYNNTGHRVKNVPSVTWVHAEMKLPEFNLQQCFFGEHLLPFYPEKKVAIVESEKSALIASFFIPELLWIASGGSGGCMNCTAAKALAGRDVVLVPDLGMTDKWKDKISIFSGICRSVSVSNYLENIATDDQRARGLDIADFLLQFASEPQILRKKLPNEWSDEEVLDYMIEKNPFIKTLMADLELKICK
jgi:hypothetical protein